MIEKKQFTYRGKNIEELNQMDIREFAKLLKARARRSVLRKYDVIQRFVQRCKKKQDKGKLIRTHERDIIIVPQMIGMVIHVYNGKEFVRVRIEQEMLGHRLGEFSITRGNVKHGAPGIGATRSSAALSVK